jgi:membrane protease YdiL (CAAX protease family)
MLRQFFSWQVFIPQQQADQPTAPKASLFFLVSFLGPREITAVLIHVPAFYAWTRANHDLYLATFFTLQLFVTAAFAAWLGRKYRAALFEPRPLTNWKNYIAVALIAAPFLIYEGHKTPRHCVSIITLVTLKPEYVPGMMRDFWTAVVGNYTIWHVAFASLTAFITPVLEEIIFTGFLLNRLICAALFALVHLLSIMTYAAENLPKLFCMSLTSQLIRLASGTLELAIACHIAANVLVLTPKWVLAYLYFAGGYV